MWWRVVSMQQCPTDRRAPIVRSAQCRSAAPRVPELDRLIIATRPGRHRSLEPSGRKATVADVCGQMPGSGWDGWVGRSVCVCVRVCACVRVRVRVWVRSGWVGWVGRKRRVGVPNFVECIHHAPHASGVAGQPLPVLAAHQIVHAYSDSSQAECAACSQAECAACAKGRGRGDPERYRIRCAEALR
jgi:hypothetical protein